MLGKIIAGSTLIANLLLWLLLTTTTPTSAGPVGILVIFVLMYVSALGLVTFLLYAVSAALARAASVVSRRSRSNALTLRQSYYYATVVALSPVMLVAMQSVNDVGVYQLLLVLVFVVIAWFYVTKRTA